MVKGQVLVVLDVGTDRILFEEFMDGMPSPAAKIYRVTTQGNEQWNEFQIKVEVLTPKEVK